MNHIIIVCRGKVEPLSLSMQCRTRSHIESFRSLAKNNNLLIITIGGDRRFSPVRQVRRTDGRTKSSSGEYQNIIIRVRNVLL